ncbi:caspase-2-like [Saccoglossus kowalevskii]|uniref:Caspase-2-like n=1 Tax=Saccoglossus kowalevskii TaxID=10224 RepID=A0ABM0GQH5_SACKO|nr:PREDICTED: caspase-2-like [Saccoglossus kowalevskii]
MADADDVHLAECSNSHVFILCNYSFNDGREIQPGFKTDAALIKETFVSLEFNTTVYYNLEAGKMSSLFSMFKHLDEDTDCLLIFLITHGSFVGVKGTDGKTITGYDIMKELSNEDCPNLANKPKMIFLSTYESDDGVQRIQRPMYPDMLIVTSSVDTSAYDAAIKDGCQYTADICKYVKKKWKKHDLSDILQIATEASKARDVREKKTGIDPHVMSTLRKPLRFK